MSSNSSSAWSSKFCYYSLTPDTSCSMRSQLSTGSLSGLLFLIVVSVLLCYLIIVFLSSNFIVFVSSYFNLTPPFILNLMVITWLDSTSWKGLVSVGFSSYFPVVILSIFSGILDHWLTFLNSSSAVMSYSSTIIPVLFSPSIIMRGYYYFLCVLSVVYGKKS